MTAPAPQSPVAHPAPGSPAPAAPDDFGSVCPQCGYNLRGLTTSTRCPECGLPVDPQDARRTRIPWAYRHSLGRFTAYGRTAWLATIHPRRLAAEMEKPVGYRDALKFRLLTCLLAVLPLAALLVAIRIWYGSTGFLTVLTTDRLSSLMFAGSTYPDPAAPWLFGTAIPWESGATLLPVLPAASFLALVLMSGVATYGFHPRRLPVVRQNRAVALGHYASAPLILLPLPAGAFIGVNVLQQMALDSPGSSFPALISLLTVVGSVSAIATFYLFLRCTLVLLRHAADAGAGKLLAAVALLPLAWAVCAAAALVGVPWVVGLVRLMITSRRG